MDKRLFFQCSNCGRYRVKEQTFVLFVTNPIFGEITKRLKEGAWGAVLKFGEQCPGCSPEQGSTEAEVLVLRENPN